MRSVAPQFSNQVRQASQSRGSSLGSLVVGRLVAVDPDGTPLVTFPRSSHDVLEARTLIAIDAGMVDREVAIAFEAGDPPSPIIVGMFQTPTSELITDRANHSLERSSDSSEQSRSVNVDGEKVVLSAEREIVLRCGDASITLTRAGKILIRGKYVLSDSSTVNRIRGGSVQIN